MKKTSTILSESRETTKVFIDKMHDLISTYVNNYFSAINKYHSECYNHLETISLRNDSEQELQMMIEEVTTTIRNAVNKFQCITLTTKQKD